MLGVPAAADGALDADVRTQLRGWYGDAVRAWRLLRVDRIAHALPRLGEPSRSAAGAFQGSGSKGLFVCGDHVATPSIQGALESGRRTAEQVHARLAGQGA
ncbi:MAG: FAD-dependent oxidoreductase [Planctomycetota bacterium]